MNLDLVLGALTVIKAGIMFAIFSFCASSHCIALILDAALQVALTRDLFKAMCEFWTLFGQLS